ncbi:MAG: protein kinase domain-containing protein [Planctomycetota bacterium]|jgi:predicted Ser/Thr protein kinase
MSCKVSEAELWSGIDRGVPEVREHIESCPTCRTRAEALEAGITAVSRASEPAEPQLPERIGEYSIKRRLGEGGMGIVYEGEQPTPRRPVAIKVIRGGGFDKYRVRLFQREAQTLARLKHPAIGAIYDAGRTDDGRDYFAMELVRGTPLTSYVREQKVLLDGRLELFIKICEAITYAHQRGVIHRDLKPSNILIDHEGRPKILDFGLARITDPDAGLTMTGTEFGRIMGTLHYMSPEEARGDLDAVDVRSDVYSLGVVFFELLSGELPYNVSRAQLPEAIRVICEQSPRKLGSIDRTLRGDLETIAAKAVEKQSDRRYQGPAAFADDIRRFLTNQPIRARRASIGYRFGKLLIRRKIFVGMLTSVLAVVAAAVIWVGSLESGVQNLIQSNQILHELEIAVVQARLGRLHHEAGQLVNAEPPYRHAWRAYGRHGRHEDMVEITLALSSVLIERGLTNELDYIAAEDVVVDTLEILDRFEAGGGTIRDSEQYYAALLAQLEHLYQPEHMDEAERLVDIRKEIETRKRFAQNRERSKQ